MTTRIIFVLALLYGYVLAIPARAQQQAKPEDPEDEKGIGLWLDQESPPVFRRIVLWISNSTNGLMRERPTCSSTGFRAVSLFDCAPGSR
jgi:hypothetical protein